MIVKYALRPDEYSESQFVYRMRMAKSRVWFRNLYGLACLAGFLGFDFRLSGSPWPGDFLIFAAGILLLERTTLWRLRTASNYRTIPSVSAPVELKIDESNLVRTSEGKSAEIRWANILACHETGNLFLLQLAADDLLVVPKRAFGPGELSLFKELREKELIVKTTRENPDLALLKFVTAWGLIAIVMMALFTGYVHNFLTRIPPARPNMRTSAAAKLPARKFPPASTAELRGSGTVYLVPFGTVKSVSVQRLLDDLNHRYGLQLHLLTPVPLPVWAKNAARKQFVAEDLVTAMKLAYPDLAANPDAVIIGITDEDMYISEIAWAYAFSWREEERFAVISCAHLSETQDDGKPAAAEILQKRARKVLIRDVGILHYRLQPSSNYSSILYNNIDDSSELDDIGDDYLESDAQVRADLQVAGGDPCFILRHYAAPERQHPEPGRVTGCSGYYKELNLETIQIDLRYGLLLDQRTDFLIPDRIPLELTRVLRTQDSRSRAFGIGGNHNLNIFLVGNKWPFTWMDLVLEHGGRSHFRRSNWGFGYWDARYTNRDSRGSMYAGSTIDWAWPGWTLKSRGMIYQFPDPHGGPRSEQGALIGMQTYDGRRLTITRDAIGNLLHAHSPAGYDLAFTYDRDSRTTEIAQGNGTRIQYSYDDSGHLARVTYPDQQVTEYGYDEAGRMTRIVESGTEVCTLAYDEHDRVKSETIPGGRTYLFHYSAAGSGDISQVDISDSAGPARRLRISAADYTLDVRTKNEP